MAIIKCKMCGGDLEFAATVSVLTALWDDYEDDNQFGALNVNEWKDIKIPQ